MLARLKQLNRDLYQLQIEPDSPYLTDEIAEPRPDMNIKVVSFTVTQSFIIYVFLLFYVSRCPSSRFMLLQ